ncbi:MAG: ribonuclease HII [Candidatus Altiarchaeota archaeon]|nr:ribonuclease HII [Candidatus Altiarchaeota archaeon]
MLLCGVDEAGRGPVIGPLVFGAVVVDKDTEGKFKEMGVTDSKLIDPATRETLAKEIQKLATEYKVLSLSPVEITEWMKTASLNDIEAIKTAELLESLDSKFNVLYVDSPDTMPARYGQNIRNLCKKDCKIISEHKADLNHTVVGAASILAKVVRDTEIRELARLYGDIGSGYPSDEVTQRWLDDHWKKNHNFPEFVRKKWSTVTRRAQLKLGEWNG